MAPKPKEALGPWLGNRVVDSKGSANSILMPPFSRLRLGTSRSVPKLCRGKPVVICSDSQAALRALDGHLVRSREVLRCRKLLEALSRANLLRLLWVPGQSGVVGNEKADRLANRDTKGIRATRCNVAIGLPECDL